MNLDVYKVAHIQYNRLVNSNKKDHEGPPTGNGPRSFDKERGEATLINVTSPTKNVPAFNETIPEIIGQRLYSSEQRWEGITAQVYQFRPPREPLHVPKDCDGVCLHLHSVVDLQEQTGARVKRGISYPGGICLQPKELESYYFWQGTPAVVLYLYLASSLVEQVVAEMGRNDPRRVEMVKQFNFHDPLIEQIGLSLVGELESGGVAGRVYAESLANALVLHLLRLSSTTSLVPPSSQRNLTQNQISTVQDYIYDRLDQDIPLKELAASIGMSASHFCRLFKQSIGQAPHQYVIACRVERAKSLLLKEERTIAQVAHAVGFADQSHLNHHFKHLLGIPPGALRKESKNFQEQKKNIQDRVGYEQAVATAGAHLREQDFTSAWTAGHTMTPEQARAELHLASLPEPAPETLQLSSPTSPNDLTARELDVLRLLTRGLTSAQIAERLVIGLVTVNFHVRSIYSKLGVTSRAAATRYALEHHLL
jgi:AraC family transcriptional regulator